MARRKKQQNQSIQQPPNHPTQVKKPAAGTQKTQPIKKLDKDGKLELVTDLRKKILKNAGNLETNKGQNGQQKAGKNVKNNKTADAEDLRSKIEQKSTQPAQHQKKNKAVVKQNENQKKDTQPKDLRDKITAPKQVTKPSAPAKKRKLLIRKKKMTTNASMISTKSQPLTEQEKKLKRKNKPIPQIIKKPDPEMLISTKKPTNLTAKQQLENRKNKPLPKKVIPKKLQEKTLTVKKPVPRPRVVQMKQLETKQPLPIIIRQVENDQYKSPSVSPQKLPSPKPQPKIERRSKRLSSPMPEPQSNLKMLPKQSLIRPLPQKKQKSGIESVSDFENEIRQSMAKRREVYRVRHDSVKTDTTETTEVHNEISSAPTTPKAKPLTFGRDRKTPPPIHYPKAKKSSRKKLARAPRHLTLHVYSSESESESSSSSSSGSSSSDSETESESDNDQTVSEISIPVGGRKITVNKMVKGKHILEQKVRVKQESDERRVVPRRKLGT